ncbi:MAG: AAA-like domain-containing protein [Clostridiales bacterium]|jgi:hypothetical protein|nr:AAA-like domain-containing protein [Clostridiales bacterium]
MGKLGAELEARGIWMKKFNVTGLCLPQKHYMVDISEKLDKIITLVEAGHYFTINRARQYGKTTTLFMLNKALPPDYTCIILSFEGVGETMFENSASFCQYFLLLISKAMESRDKDFAAAWLDESVTNFILLGFHLDKLCKDRKIVLLIDEIDKSSNNQIFLHFLGMLRSKYLSRENGYSFTFHSVILAGVYDIKNIKLKMISEGALTQGPDESKIYNSPWNIAVNFKVDMSFSSSEIATMLTEYKTDNKKDLDISIISEKIYGFTSGYPFLVSRICQAIDEELGKDWTPGGVQDAVTIILGEKNTLFDDLIKNIENNKKLADFLYDLLLIGAEKYFNTDNSLVNLGFMYGFIKNSDGMVKISNMIFETRIYNYFISENNINQDKKKITGVFQEDVVRNGKFDMELCLQKFRTHYLEIFSERDQEFIENNGRLLFLTYLKPLINGQGFYHIESQLVDLRRMDIVVDFGRDQFIIEIKIWRGGSKHQEAYEQLLGYMDSKNARVGYLLTFDFRKEVNKLRCAKWVGFDSGKRIFDVVL